jgi:hypothetical protein
MPYPLHPARPTNLEGPGMFDVLLTLLRFFRGLALVAAIVFGIPIVTGSLAFLGRPSGEILAMLMMKGIAFMLAAATAAGLRLLINRLYRNRHPAEAMLILPYRV